MMSLTVSISVCLISFAGLLWLLRRDKASLGLPVAYLFLLLLIHLPGGLAHLVGARLLSDNYYTEWGMEITAISVVSFAAGVWISRTRNIQLLAIDVADRATFWKFCLFGGWFVTYALGFARHVPTLGALVDKGGAIWLLGVMLGLRAAVKAGNSTRALFWLAALAVYPTLMFLLGGFLSYGSTAIVIVLATLSISTRSGWRVAIGIAMAALLGFNLFLSYFQNRENIRDAVWGGATLSERLAASEGIVTDFAWFDSTNEDQLVALDQRLNQNFFVGLSAARIDDGQAEFLLGRSLWQGVLALVPRAIWPEKPVFGGSPQIVSEMTGLILSEGTSFGIGNVMEAYINFGYIGVLVGFLLFGWMLGWLDRRAAISEMSGELGRTMVFFLPAVAMIQPNGSFVELAGGGGAGWVIGLGWAWLWVYRQAINPSSNVTSASADRRVG